MPPSACSRCVSRLPGPMERTWGGGDMTSKWNAVPRCFFGWSNSHWIDSAHIRGNADPIGFIMTDENRAGQTKLGLILVSTPTIISSAVDDDISVVRLKK